MSKVKISSLASMDPQQFTNYVRLRNWKRNNQLINFDSIPEVITNRIMETYNDTEVKTTISIPYFIQNNIQDIMEEFA